MAYQQLTLADLQTRLKSRWEEKPYWTDTEATLYLNEALQTWGLLTGRWKQRITLETVANTYEVALPQVMTFRMRVDWNGRPLDVSARDDLNNGQPRWRQETTASGGSVPRRPTLWAPVSLGLIYVWPADADSHNAWGIDGVSATPVLVNAGDYVDLGTEDIPVLLNFALHVASLKKGGPWFQATLPYFTAFLQAAALENSLITTSQAYRRFMGWDRRGLKPLVGAPSSLAALIASQTPAQ